MQVKCVTSRRSEKVKGRHVCTCVTAIFKVILNCLLVIAKKRILPDKKLSTEIKENSFICMAWQEQYNI